MYLIFEIANQLPQLISNASSPGSWVLPPLAHGLHVPGPCVCQLCFLSSPPPPVSDLRAVATRFKLIMTYCCQHHHDSHPHCNHDYFEILSVEPRVSNRASIPHTEQHLQRVMFVFLPSPLPPLLPFLLDNLNSVIQAASCLSPSCLDYQCASSHPGLCHYTSFPFSSQRVFLRFSRINLE